MKCESPKSVQTVFGELHIHIIRMFEEKESFVGKEKWKCSSLHSFLNQDIISNFRNYPDLPGFKTLLPNKIMDKK